MSIQRLMAGYNPTLGAGPQQPGMGGQQAPGQMNPAIQGITSYPARQQGGFGQPQMVPQQGMGGQPPQQLGGALQSLFGGQQPQQAKPLNPMMQQQAPMQSQAMGMNMGGSVGMAPPNPYAQQVGQEDPRMQAMRNMQMMNFGG